jgi:hypothetical protein
MKCMRALIWIGMIGLLPLVEAQADPLGLTQAFPDILVTSNTVTYNAGTDQFLATGRPLTLTLPDLSHYNITGTTVTSYNLTATIVPEAGSPTAGEITSGTLSVGGKINGLGATTGTLLTASFSQFGNTDTGSLLEFLFTTTGGDLASYFGGIGGTIGVIISPKSTNFIDFDHNFSNGSGATNDTFASPVPVPAAAPLLLLGLGSIAALRRWRAC